MQVEEPSTNQGAPGKTVFLKQTAAPQGMKKKGLNDLHNVHHEHFPLKVQQTPANSSHLPKKQEENNSFWGTNIA